MAGYNNYFPQNYPNLTNLYSATPTPVPNSTIPGINWVQGEAGARAIVVPAGQKVLLMDSENNVFYVKSSDVSGMPLPLRTFEYKEVGVEETTDSAPAPTTYVTKEELNSILSDFRESLKEKKNEQFAI